MAYADPGSSFPPSLYGALGPPQGAIGGLGGAARRQAQPKLSHVKVPVSTLIGLLMAEAVKPVASARPRAMGAMAGAATSAVPQRVNPGGLNRPPGLPLFQTPQPSPNQFLQRLTGNWARNRQPRMTLFARPRPGPASYTPGPGFRY